MIAIPKTIDQKPSCLLKLFLFSLLIIFANTFQAFSQGTVVTGKVTGATGEPLSGVSILVKGTKSGTSTNNEGNFSINVTNPNAALVVTSLGYDPQEIGLAGRNSIPITLAAASTQLNQVVVVGYGTSRRKDLTGSVASIKGAELAKQPVQTATQALQGKVAGVQIISSGQPNSLPTVRVRGTGTMLGGANPLYVVDGVITDDIRNINSADIVNLDVLKDASATAIYGMRAANGVLIITTKKGRSGKMIISYDANVGIKEASHLVDMAGPNQYANYVNEASIYYGTGDSLITGSKLAAGNNTDWYDAILRRGFWQNHNISVSGGSEKINYFLSAGYINEEGILLTNKFNRFTLRSNNEYKLSKDIKFSTLLSYSRADLDDVDLGVFNDAYRAAPYVASKTGNLYGNTSLSNNVGNPLLGLEKNYNKGIDNRFQGTFAVDIKPVSWLTLRSSYGIDLDFYKNTRFAYSFGNLGDKNIFIEQGGNQLRDKSSLGINKNDASRWVWDNTATATKDFGVHKLSLLVGTTSEKYTLNSLSGNRVDVPENRDQWFLGAGSSIGATNDNTGDKFTRSSYIGRLNYNYNDRYLITATFRADGTSRFSEENRWGYFPSVGVAWNISNESFMANQKTFGNLKLRASWGKVGNDQIPTGAYLPLAATNIPYFFDQPRNQYLGISFNQLSDQNVKWEVTDEYDFGVDFSVLDNHLTGEIDYYNKKTKDALVYVNIPGILGDADNKYITNAASFENKGVEFGLNWNDRINKDWNYNLSGNIAYNKNRIVGLNGGQALFDGGIGGNQGFTTKSDNGQPIGSFYLLQTDGIFQTIEEVAASAQPDALPGDLRYRDISGTDGKPDGTINDLDRVYLGSYQPKLTFGLSGGLTYKNFDFNFGTYGTAGGKIYNGKKGTHGADPRDNIEASVAKDRWTPNNPNTDVPRASLNQLPASTYFLEKGDFLRINNLTLGYKLSGGLLSKYKISNLRIYITAQNLATITNYTGFTPEVSRPGDNPLNAGIELSAYPSTRTFALGVNLSF